MKLGSPKGTGHEERARETDTTANHLGAFRFLQALKGFQVRLDILALRSICDLSHRLLHQSRAPKMGGSQLPLHCPYTGSSIQYPRVWEQRALLGTAAAECAPAGRGAWGPSTTQFFCRAVESSLAPEGPQPRVAPKNPLLGIDAGHGGNTSHPKMAAQNTCDQQKILGKYWGMNKYQAPKPQLKTYMLIPQACAKYLPAPAPTQTRNRKLMAEKRGDKKIGPFKSA